MSSTSPLLSLAHLHRGSWVAAARDEPTKRTLGEAPIPVIRDQGDGCWTWTGQHGALFEKEGDPDLFDGKGRPDWLARFEDGAIVRVRNGTAEKGSKAEGSNGVWRIGAVEKGPRLLRFRVVERIGITG